MDDALLLRGPEFSTFSGEKARQLVILLHGLGADGSDLIPLAPEFAKALPHAHFYSPDAPFRCDMSPVGYQWFSMQDWSPEKMITGARHVSPILSRFIDAKLKQHGLDDSQLALAGFSQGAMMALHVALRRKKPCAGVVSYSGALLDACPLEEEVISRPPVCLVHGLMDPVVPFFAMERALKKLRVLGVRVDNHERPMLAHAIDDAGIRVGQAFLYAVFNPQPGQGA